MKQREITTRRRAPLCGCVRQAITSCVVLCLALPVVGAQEWEHTRDDTRPSSPTCEQLPKEWLTGRRQIRGSTESGNGSRIKSQLVPQLGSLEVRFVM